MLTITKLNLTGIQSWTYLGCGQHHGTSVCFVFCVATFLILIMKYEEGRNHNSIKLLMSVHLTENVCVFSTFPGLWIC